jgi:hypothetical protein
MAITIPESVKLFSSERVWGDGQRLSPLVTLVLPAAGGIAALLVEAATGD